LFNAIVLPVNSFSRVVEKLSALEEEAGINLGEPVPGTGEVAISKVR
jgi:hypothetical protein